MKKLNKQDKMTITELNEISKSKYGNLVKAVIDISSDILVIDVEMHVDAEGILLEIGSDQRDLWGINLYPENFNKENFVEFDSIINIKPSQNNMSRYIEDKKVRNKIIKLVNEKIIE